MSCSPAPFAARVIAGSLVPALAFSASGGVAEPESGLEVRYTFEGSDGERVPDVSGHGRHGIIVGSAKRVVRGQSRAFVFDGRTRIECGKILPAAMRAAGTIEGWGRMDVVAGSFFSSHTSDGNRWGKRRLRLGAITWNDSRLLAAATTGGTIAAGTTHVMQARSDVDLGQWAYWVMTWDSVRFCLYRNGILLEDVPCGLAWPNVKDVPCYVGYGSYAEPFFQGAIAEVAVYSKALPPEEIARRFRKGIKHFDLEELLKARLYCSYDHLERQMLAALDLSDLLPLPAGTSVAVSLVDREGEVVETRTANLQARVPSLTLAFETASLTAGTHRVTAVVSGADGTALGEPVRRTWHYQPLAALASRDTGVRVLNNMVFELLREENLELSMTSRTPTPRTWTFELPDKSWVHVAAAVRLDDKERVSVNVDSGTDDAIVHINAASRATAQEGVRLLQAGEHTLFVWGGGTPLVETLTLRVIPETIFVGTPNASVNGMGNVGFDFLEEDVLPNFTSMCFSAGGTLDYPRLRIWKSQGKRLYQEQNIPTLANPSDMPSPLTADYAHKWWTESWGFSRPLFDGVMADEFSGSGDGAHIRAYTEAIKRIARTPEYRDKSICIWGAEMYAPSDTMDMIKAAQEAGYKICWELYKAECRTPEQMDQWLTGYLRETMAKWEQAYPGVARHMIPTLATFSIVHLGVDAWPQVDFKVHLDKQFHRFANAPEFFGLYGISNWIARYTNEEYIRWYGRLARHYCIEGKRNLLSDEYGYAYCPGILSNGGFAEKLKHWTVSPAAEVAITTGQEGLLTIAVGYWHVADAGRTYVAMRRAAEAPNLISQALRNITPGQAYSVKVTAVDLDDVKAGKGSTRPAAPQLSVRLDGAQRIENRCFKRSINRRGQLVRSIRYVFRASTESPTLTIGDWEDEGSPGGPVGQNTAINCVQVAPYFE